MPRCGFARPGWGGGLRGPPPRGRRCRRGCRRDPRPDRRSGHVATRSRCREPRSLPPGGPQRRPPSCRRRTGRPRPRAPGMPSPHRPPPGGRRAARASAAPDRSPQDAHSRRGGREPGHAQPSPGAPRSPPAGPRRAVSSPWRTAGRAGRRRPPSHRRSVPSPPRAADARRSGPTVARGPHHAGTPPAGRATRPPPRTAPPR